MENPPGRSVFMDKGTNKIIAKRNISLLISMREEITHNEEKRRIIRK